MISNQTIDLDKVVSMKRAWGGWVYDSFSSTHYARLMELTPNLAAEYIALFNPVEEVSAKEDNEAPSNFTPIEKPIVEEKEVEMPKIEEVIKENPIYDTEYDEKVALVAKLKSSGMKIAWMKWGIEVLRRKVSLLPA